MPDTLLLSPESTISGVKSRATGREPSGETDGTPQRDRGRPRRHRPPLTQHGAARAEKVAAAPPRVRDLYRRAWNGSRKAAIRIFCLECVGYNAADVHRCTAPACPLYEFRLDG